MIKPHVTSLPADITCIDTGLFRPGMAACYLLRHAGKAALIETGVSNTVGRILNALSYHDVQPEDVLYVIPTHVHLDHAGGAGALLQRLPEARLVIHPRGARHMIDPGRLWAGSAEIYGEAVLERIYGAPVPVAAGRIIVADDGCVIDLAGRELLFIDTPGHARHHFSVYDGMSKGFFTGDTFGISYRETDSPRGPFIMPTTTPVQFDPPAWHASIDRYLSFKPQRMYLTHFCMVEEVSRLAAELHRQIDHYADTALRLAQADDCQARIGAALTTWTLQALAAHQCPLPASTLRGMLKMDMELNAAGLKVWLDSTR